MAADQQLAGVRHGAEVGGDVDGVGDEQQRHHHMEQPRRIMPARIARNAVPGDAADARGDFLDRRHQRKRQQHGPADAVAELRAGLAVGADARRIVVGRAGDQAGAERLQRIAEAKRPGGCARITGRLDVDRAQMLDMLRIRFAICHAKGPAGGQRRRQAQVPGKELAGGPLETQANSFSKSQPAHCATMTRCSGRDAPGVHRLIARVVAQCSAVNVPPSGNSTSSRIDGQA